jgi:predicted RNase H-like HicB family nuclease
MEYVAYLHKDPKSDFGVSFPDFPGCVTAGRTLEEARQMATKALTFHMKGITEDGGVLPQPSSVDDIAHDPAAEGAVMFLVDVDIERTVRINITARESQVKRIDELAEAAGLNRSAYMVRSAIDPKASTEPTKGRRHVPRSSRRSRPVPRQNPR